ncbi:uncharacterized protein LOC122725934 [Dromiciops gliroides]|uniref:uncharacterized protein LOC122725934 n=1 Tax=Dromiciops gliroides TaxID=33562 RepID=UPI001CC6749E|nr:uncharacterized protein LOC122725934 [Dromiciops gliroides]
MGRPPMKALFANKLVCFQFPRVLATLVYLLVIPGAPICGIQTPLHGIKGGSTLFHLNISSGEKIKTIMWSFEFEKGHQKVLFDFTSEDEPLKWGNLKDRYEQRVHMLSKPTSLCIRNLTLEDHGCYCARIQYHNGILSYQSFCLFVHEPLLLTIKKLSKNQRSDWCNLTLECQALEAGEEVEMTWGSGDIPNMLLKEDRLTSNSSIVNLSLPPNLQNSSLTCLAKSRAEQKNFTLDLRDICVEKSSTLKPTWSIGIFLLLILLGILGTGMWICRRKEKKKKVTDPSKNQRNSDNSIQYAVLSPDRHPEAQNQCQEAGEQQPQEREPLTTIYSEIQKTTRQYSGELSWPC